MSKAERERLEEGEEEQQMRGNKHCEDIATSTGDRADYGRANVHSSPWGSDDENQEQQTRSTEECLATETNVSAEPTLADDGISVRDFALEAAEQVQGETANIARAAMSPARAAAMLEKQRRRAERNINDGVLCLFEYYLSNEQQEDIQQYIESWAEEYRKVAWEIIRVRTSEQGDSSGKARKEVSLETLCHQDRDGIWLDLVLGGFAKDEGEGEGKGVVYLQRAKRRPTKKDAANEKEKDAGVRLRAPKIQANTPDATRIEPGQSLRVQRLRRTKRQHIFDDSQLIPPHERITGFHDFAALPQRDIDTLHNTPVDQMNWREKITYHASLPTYGGKDDGEAVLHKRTEKWVKWAPLSPSKGVDLLATLDKRTLGDVSVRELYQTGGRKVEALGTRVMDEDSDGVERIDWAVRRADERRAGE